MKWPIIARFADIFSSPERMVAWSLLQRCTMEKSIFSSDFRVVFVITFTLKAILYKERHALGIMIKHNSNERDTQSIDTLKHLTEIVVVVDLLSHGSTYTHCWIN